MKSNSHHNTEGYFILFLTQPYVHTMHTKVSISEAALVFISWYVLFSFTLSSTCVITGMALALRQGNINIFMEILILFIRQELQNFC